MIFKKITAGIGKLIKTAEEKEVTDKLDEIFPEDKKPEEKTDATDQGTDHNND